MPINPRIIPHKPREIGAAMAHVDVMRRVKSLEGKYGVFGAGATVTGAVITTADTGQKVYIQGPDAPGGAGLFGTDPSGNVVVSLVPGTGLALQSGPDEWNQISWSTGPTLAASIGVSSGGGGGTLNSMFMEVSTQIAPGSTSLNLNAMHGGGGGSATIVNNDGVNPPVTVVLINSSGNGIWPQGIGFWGKIPPASQPAHAVTLADVINILANYGMCA